ncbi:hypothetical protein V6N13_101530 [Hibiscus sabdariffa]
MDLTVSESIMEIHHFSHHHPLVIQDQGFASEAAHCFGCDRSLEGSSTYACTELLVGVLTMDLATDATLKIADHPLIATFGAFHY